MLAVFTVAVAAFYLPGSFAAREDDYAFVRTLVDIQRQVSANYVDDVKAEDLRHGAIEGLMRELDPFSEYVPPADQDDFNRMLEGSFQGVGVLLNQKEDGEIEVVTPIDDSPAARAGVQAGDIIVKVNDESIAGMLLQDVIAKVKGAEGSTVKIRFKRPAGEVEYTLARSEIQLQTVKGFSRNEDNSWNYFMGGGAAAAGSAAEPKVAYVRLTQFTSDTAERLAKVLEQLTADGLEGLVLDLRFNPGGQLEAAVQIADMFLETGTIVSVKGRARPERVERATPAGTLKDFPLVVLVNEFSASASEVLAGALQDQRRATVVGMRSYGKGSVQEVIPLANSGGELKLTVAHYYLPSGRLVHRKKDATEWGVEPQIKVEMTADQQQSAAVQRVAQENFRRAEPATSPTTQPVGRFGDDVQLEKAFTTVVGLIAAKQK
jgi:carboxyl-terminal processing protease